MELRRRLLVAVGTLKRYYCYYFGNDSTSLIAVNCRPQFAAPVCEGKAEARRARVEKAESGLKDEQNELVHDDNKLDQAWTKYAEVCTRGVAGRQRTPVVRMKIPGAGCNQNYFHSAVLYR